MKNRKYHYVIIENDKNYQEIKNFTKMCDEASINLIENSSIPFLAKIPLCLPFTLGVYDIKTPLTELKDLFQYHSNMRKFYMQFKKTWQKASKKEFAEIIKVRDIAIIANFPHASCKLPSYFYKNTILSVEELNIANTKMSDVEVDKLFTHLKAKKIKPSFSRLFCDVERFEDEEKEIMAKYGQGILYTHLYNGKQFRNKIPEKYRENVMKYYYRYHDRLDRISQKLLGKHKELLILDCHSFSEEVASYLIKGKYPDICIGTESEYFDEEIFYAIINCIISKGYNIEIDFPYKGSIIPRVFLNNKQKDKKITTFMIEINKKIYL